MLRGRAFTEQDDGAAPGVVIINQAMARQYWPKGDPLKDRIQIGAGAGPAFAEPPRQVVGVVGDTRDDGVDRDPSPRMYIPIAQMPDAETALNSQAAPLWWIVRSRVDPYTLRAPIEAALREASGGLPVAHMRTMAEVEVRNTARQRFNMLLLTIFGAAGLLMAAIGVYGVMSYSVQQRTQELGVRMALGAQASNLRNMVIGQGMILAGVGVVLGIGGAFWLTRFLASFLFRCQSVGSRRVHRHAADSQRGRPPRRLDSGAEGNSRRPHDRASARIAERIFAGRRGSNLVNASKSLAWPSILIPVLMMGLRAGAQSVTTSQYDNARSGANRVETILTPRNVNVRHFGKLFTLKVDGDVYAQPLFLAGLEIPGKGRHDVLFIATEHDSVYAFDAYGHPAVPLWRVNFLRKGVTTVPEDDVECPFIAPEVGITSTPVIDADTGTLYVLARTKELPSSRYKQRLHALSVTTGLRKVRWSGRYQGHDRREGNR